MLNRLGSVELVVMSSKLVSVLSSFELEAVDKKTEGIDVRA